jgi:hypothetical protein
MRDALRLIQAYEPPGLPAVEVRRLIVHAIEAADLTQGTGLTSLVAVAVGTVAAAILDDIGSLPPAT